MVQESRMVVFDTDENSDLRIDSRHQAVIERIRQKSRPILSVKTENMNIRNACTDRRYIHPTKPRYYRDIMK